MTDNDILAKYGVPPNDATVTPKNPDDEILAKYGAGAPGISDKLIDAGKTGLNIAGKVLGYPGGVARTSLAQLAQLFTDKEITKPGDVMETLKGNAPRTDDYLQRAGVPEGKVTLPIDLSMDWNKFGRYTPVAEKPSEQEGTPYSFSTRKAAGAVGDIASDMGAIKGLSKLAAVGGKNLYKKAFAREDAIAAANNKIPTSDIMLEEGAVPITKNGVAKAQENALSRVGQNRSDIVSDVAATGERQPIDTALAPGKDFISRLESKSAYSPETQNALAIMKSDLAKREAMAHAANEAGPTIDEALQAKKALGDTVSDADFRAFNTSTGSGYKKAVAGGYKDLSEKIAENAIPGYGEALSGENARMSSLLSTLPDAQRKALVESSKHGITQVDAALAALNPHAEALKLLAKGGHLPGAKTVPGYAAYKAGQFLNPTQSLERGLQIAAPVSAWETMRQQ